MTLIRRAGRFAGLSVMVGLVLAGCDKGPDRKQVAADLQKGVEAYLAQIEGPQDKRVVSHSAVNVAPQQDAGYLVKIDGLKVGAPGEGYLDVGTISYVLTVKDDKTYDASQLSIANDMPFKSADGQTTDGDLKLTNKSFTGTWLKDAERFIKLDLQFADLTVSDPKLGDDAKIAGAAFNVDSTDKGQGVWDQNGKFALTGLDVTNATDGHLAIKEIDVTSVLQGLKIVEYAGKMRALRDAISKQASAAPAPTTDASGQATTAPANAASDPVAAATKDFADALPSLLAGLGSDFHVSGISYQAMDQSASFDLGKAGFSFAIVGLDSAKTSLKLTIDHDALAVHAPALQNDLMQALLPANGALVISLNNVPTKELTALSADLVPLMNHPEQADMEAQGAVIFAKLQQLLQSDGVSLKVEPSHLTSAAANVGATGDFAIQATAAHGAVGALDVAITGLDQVIAVAQKQADQDPEAAQYASMAQVLLTYANREQGSDGKAVDKFKIDVPPAGQLTVNGKPLPF